MKRIALMLSGVLLGGSALAGAPPYEQAAGIDRIERARVGDQALNRFGTPYPVEFEDAYLGGASFGDLDLVGQTALYTDPNPFTLGPNDLTELELERRQMALEDQRLAQLGYDVRPGVGVVSVARVQRVGTITPVLYDTTMTGQRIQRVEFETDDRSRVERALSLDDPRNTTQLERELAMGEGRVEEQLMHAGFTIHKVDRGLTEWVKEAVTDVSQARQVQIEDIEMDGDRIVYHIEVQEGGQEYDITASRSVAGGELQAGMITPRVQQAGLTTQRGLTTQQQMQQQQIRRVALQRPADATYNINGTLSYGLTGGWDLQPQYRIISQTPQQTEVLVTLSTDAPEGAQVMAQPEPFSVDLEIPELRGYQGEVILIVQDEQGNELRRLNYR